MFLPFSLTPASVFIVASSVFIYLLQQTSNNLEVALFISQSPYLGLAEIRHGEFYRLFTPMLLHFSLIHITFNSILFLQLGQMIEWRFGSFRFLILTLSLAAFSNLAQFLFEGPYFGGLSGVIYGFFGFIWLQSYINPEFQLRLPKSFIIMFFVLFVVSWLGLLGLSIANVAHTAGFLFGLFYAILYKILKIRCRDL